MARITKGAEKDNLQTINFNELQKGDIFRFTGKKKLYEVNSRTKFTICYCDLNDISGFAEKKKTCKLTVQINTCMETSEQDYIEYLNDLGTPEEHLRSNGGLVPASAQWGNWMARNNKIGFQVGFQEFKTNY